VGTLYLLFLKSIEMSEFLNIFPDFSFIAKVEGIADLNLIV
jgi:hypothetical protein